jgi:tetratricopeptide (TPR) repeat protein
VAEPAAPPPSAAPASDDRGGGGGGGGGGPPPGRDYSFYVDRGDELQQSGRGADARRYFQSALGLRPDGREALTGLGFIALAQNDVGTAMGYLRGPAAAGYGEAMIGMGEAYRKSNRGAEALAAYREYLTRFPSGAEASIARRWVSTLAAEHDRPASAPLPEASEPAERRDSLPAPAESDAPPPASDAPALQGE